MLDLSLPSPEEQQQLLAVHAHRYPQRAKIPVLGDGGAALSLPVLLGLPSGACRQQGAKVAPIWRAIVAGMLAQKIDAAAISDPLVADCVLWPDPRRFATWRARWPALADNIAAAVLRLVGAQAQYLVEPSPIEEPSEAIAAALTAHPRAMWRRFDAPTGKPISLVVDTPDMVRFDAWDDALGRSDTDPVALCREFAEAQLVACESEDKLTPSAMFDRLPGLTILVAALARRLAGAQGQVQLGEW